MKDNKIIFIAVIGILLCGVFYLIFNTISLGKNIENLKSEKDILVNEKESIQTDLSELQLKYDLLEEDVAKIYKTCIVENACKGHYPGVSWYCNNVGDEVITNYSHTCVCNSACILTATEIK